MAVLEETAQGPTGTVSAMGCSSAVMLRISLLRADGHTGTPRRVYHPDPPSLLPGTARARDPAHRSAKNSPPRSNVRFAGLSAVPGAEHHYPLRRDRYIGGGRRVTLPAPPPPPKKRFTALMQRAQYGMPYTRTFQGAVQSVQQSTAVHSGAPRRWHAAVQFWAALRYGCGRAGRS
eukprot:3526596-Rhodomonas_salina.2